MTTEQSVNVGHVGDAQGDDAHSQPDTRRAEAGDAQESETDSRTAAAAKPEKKWERDVVRLLNVVGVLLSVVLIISLTIETFSKPSVAEKALYLEIQFLICIYFLIDFLILFCISRNKKAFLSRHFIMIFVAIPYLNILESFPISLSENAMYLIRFIPIARGGVALVVLVNMVVKKSVTTMFISYIIIFFSMIYFQTLIFYVFESGVNPQMTSYSDAVWWAAMTVTTLGSSILPVTTIGKASATTLAVVGMTTFPIFTVYVTSLVQGFSKKSH
ncbi:MAG: ion channel [Pigmentiphaga sp.]